MTKKTQPIRQRLINGAKILGDLWRETAEHCDDLWAMKCSCDTPSMFCKGKLHWVKLAKEQLSSGGVRQLPKQDHSYALFEMMTAEEVAATRVTVNISIPGHGVVKVGPDGVDPSILKVSPDLLEATKLVLETFPGSKVVKEEQGEPKAAKE
jgi:hypothetical protein